MSFFRNFPKVNYDYFGNGVQSKVIDIFRFVQPAKDFKDELGAYSFYEVQEGDRPDVVSQKLYNTPEYYWTFFLVNEHLRNGISAWPLSSDEFNKFIDEEYSGIVITCRPQYNYDGDGLLQSIENSVAGKFRIGEQVVGFLSGATGFIESKDATSQQLVIRDVQGVFRKEELIRGNSTEDSIESYEVYDRQLAPRHYEDDKGRIVNSSIHISGGTPPQQLNLITNREFEEELNNQRSKIRVIREEFIFEFADRYQELLNR